MNRVPLFVALLGFLCFTGISSAFGQNAGTIFKLFDSAWQVTTAQERASYFVRERSVNSTLIQRDYYRVNGALVKIETLTAKGKNIAHGSQAWYGANGFIDSLGDFENGIRSGDWYSYDDTGGVQLKRHFEKGRLIWQKDYTKEEQSSKEDSSIKYESAEFKGVPGSWQRFISKNLLYPQSAVDQEIEGEVRIRFVVDEEGQIIDPWVERSVEISLDDEALRLINSSPDWKPARENGKLVKDYKLQPFYYKLKI